MLKKIREHHQCSAEVHLDTHQLLLSLSLFLRCAIINDDPGCLTQTVKCWGMEGRFINFYTSSDQAGYQTLCEVKVYGGRNPAHHYMIIKHHLNGALQS